MGTLLYVLYNILLFALVNSGMIVANFQTSQYPCFRRVQVLGNITEEDDMPEILKKSLEQEATRMERYIVSIPSYTHLCEYIQKKLIVVFLRLYNVEIDIFDTEKKLTNMSTGENGNVALDFRVKLYLLSIENLITKVIIIKKKSCKLKGGAFMEDTLDCLVAKRGKVNSNFTSAKAPDRHVVWMGLIAFGNVISILGLLVLFFVYWKTAKLELVFPRKCVLYLSALQLLLHLLQLTSLYVKETLHACTGISILSHWLALCAFVWLSCASLEVNWLLGRDCMLNKEERLVAYSSVSFGLTAITVLSCTILHFSTKKTIGYGRGLLCFVGDKWGMFYSFLLPIGGLLLCNIVWTVCNYKRCVTLSRSNPKNGSDGDSNTRHKLSFAYSCLVISLLILLCRILENVSVPYSTVYWMSVLLTSLHGVMILIGMLANRKVLKTAKTAFSKKKRDRVTYAYKHGKQQRGHTERGSRSCTQKPAVI